MQMLKQQVKRLIVKSGGQDKKGQVKSPNQEVLGHETRLELEDK